ncbi:rubredoxin [uncultured Methanoregula sp.]|uniref:rubredoxin n=1 Tax=uncultured Methanoregula sp. TaxID=1005933 RepID=UPI002AAC3E3F|nr:rubredoxin [uncultured Methanoregula sp.]
MVKTTATKKKSVKAKTAKPAVAKKGVAVAAKKAVTTKKAATAPVKKVTKNVTKKPVQKPVVKAPAKKKVTKKAGQAPARYRCRLCGYIYSPLRGEPHNGIPVGTEFDDLPDSYVCPVCGQQGKGRIGKWGFEEWRPTRYLCSMCNYVYDEKRGEPHRGIKPGTKFEDLPDDYTCPVCALDPKIRVQFGKVFKQGFEPLYLG